MKKIKENITEEEFQNYLENIIANMESATTYFGQEDEYVPYYDDLQRRHIYGEEENEHEVVLYIRNYSEQTDTITYDIFDEIS